MLKEMCSFVAHPCLVWEKNTVVAKVTKTFPMLDALTKAQMVTELPPIL